MMNIHMPNGTKEDIKLGILHEASGYWISNEGTKAKPSYHVWITNGTHYVFDYAFDSITIAWAYCNSRSIL